MASRLAPCPSCTRHVKVGSSSCPFCGGDVPVEVAPRPFAIASGKPISRAAILFASAAAVSACSSSSAGKEDAGQIQAAYGGFVHGDASIDDDAGQPEPLYGVATMVDAGQPQSHYGVVTIPDAGEGEDDSGQVQALYGAMVNPDGGT